MSTASLPKIKRWNETAYRRFAKVRCGWDSSVATVWFEDGSEVSLDLGPYVPENLVEIDWWRTASNEIEIIAPHAGGWFEIPWEVIRRATDTEFAAHWDAAMAAPAKVE
jgi:hypothetical protein